MAQEEEIPLAPIVSTLEEVQRAREEFSVQSRSIRWWRWILLFAVWIAFGIVVQQSWLGGLPPFVAGIVMLLQSCALVRAQKRLAAELNKVERLYSMTRKGLKYRISFNGKPSKPVVIPWTAMSRGEETAEGVLIRFGHAEPKFFPNSCFLKPEDKATLLHMAYGKGLI